MSWPWRRSSGRSRRRREGMATYGDWVRVAIAPNEMVTGMLVGALESEGIPVLSKKIGLDFPTSPSNQQLILVPAGREEEAKHLLEGIWDIQQ